MIRHCILRWSHVFYLKIRYESLLCLGDRAGRKRELKDHSAFNRLGLGACTDLSVNISWLAEGFLHNFILLECSKILNSVISMLFRSKFKFDYVVQTVDFPKIITSISFKIQYGIVFYLNNTGSGFTIIFLNKFGNFEIFIFF